MSNKLLKINNINVSAALRGAVSNTIDSKTKTENERETGVKILYNLSLEINEGETHVLLGPNGAGKSTLGYTLIGSPEYVVTDGEILFDGNDITHESADKRAKMGMFMSFQSPVDVPGITLNDFIKEAIRSRTGKSIPIFKYKRELSSTMKALSMDEKYADRDVNVGFSGGEKKKSEILQLLMLNPKLAILDETDSGLDVDAVKTVSAGIAEYQKRQNGALLIITHSTRILSSLNVDYTHIMINGRIVAEGGPELVEEINQNGFKRFINQTQPI
ncbi:MAG: Fe-S cluster assembly ATPase SufC [Eubacteriales bacterium]|jgi:Fe-S cluster assembly ATP-binding protein